MAQAQSTNHRSSSCQAIRMDRVSSMGRQAKLHVNNVCFYSFFALQHPVKELGLFVREDMRRTEAFFCMDAIPPSPALKIITSPRGQTIETWQVPTLQGLSIRVVSKMPSSCRRQLPACIKKKVDLYKYNYNRRNCHLHTECNNSCFLCQERCTNYV